MTRKGLIYRKIKQQTNRQTSISGQSGPDSNDNERVLQILKSSKRKDSLADFLVLCTGYVLVGLTPLQSVSPTAPDNWATSGRLGVTR